MPHKKPSNKKTPKQPLQARRKKATPENTFLRDALITALSVLAQGNKTTVAHNCQDCNNAILAHEALAVCFVCGHVADPLCQVPLQGYLVKDIKVIPSATTFLPLCEECEAGIPSKCPYEQRKGHLRLV